MLYLSRVLLIVSSFEAMHEHEAAQTITDEDPFEGDHGLRVGAGQQVLRDRVDAKELDVTGLSNLGSEGQAAVANLSR